MIEITPEQHTTLVGMTYSRPPLRALLGETLTEEQFVALKRHYLKLRRECGWVPPATKCRPRKCRRVF